MAEETVKMRRYKLDVSIELTFDIEMNIEPSKVGPMAPDRDAALQQVVYDAFVREYPEFEGKVDDVYLFLEDAEDIGPSTATIKEDGTLEVTRG